ncbi:MAG: response regulator transcription factor [Verrucomicrobiota bacterium]|jgi:DNA-binding NarL/FixJ family response regulator
MTTVAIIEDNDTMRKMLAELINREPGYRCICACSTSREALIEVPKQQPDVALMDIYLPDESGIACTARLTEIMPDLQVIMVTVYKDTDLIFQALKAGACGYILKRFRPEEIIQAISEVRAGGAPMTSEIARMVVRSFRAPSAAPLAVPDQNGLTTREAEILMLLAEGLSNKEIAQRANISAGTVRIHLEHIFKKLHVRSRTEAAIKYSHKN